MKMMLWTLGGIAMVVAAGALALQIAISHNGPAVLDTIDRLAGGTGGAERKATISIGEHAQQKLVVWGPKAQGVSDAPLPVLVFFHGGSWRSGDPVDYGFVARAFVPEGFVVVLGGYRLGEAGAYPAMLDDTARVIAWTQAEIARYGGDPDRIVIAGHSAGAYNVAMVSLEEQWLSGHGLGTSDIAGVVGLSGPYDFFPFDSESTIAAFGEAPDPEATQPINQVNGSVRPTLLLHGEEDTLVYPRNTRALARAIAQRDSEAAKTVFYPDFDHNAPLISLAAPWRDRREVRDQMVDFAGDVTARQHQAYQTSVSVQTETR